MAAPLALVRRPSSRLAEGIVTHQERRPVDYELACQQWEGYVAALEGAGWSTLEIPRAEDCPDSVFIEDTMVVYGDLAVIARPGAPSRRPETLDAHGVIANLGYTVRSITGPATLDGGDVLKIDRTVYVGCGARTNAEGARQLGELLSPLGARVVPVPLARVLHLKSAVTALPDGTVIGYRPLVEDPSAFEPFLPVAEESGAHVVVLGPAAVLMAADCPDTAAQLTDLGYQTVRVDISEFQKLDGCVTCLSVRLRLGSL